MITNKTFLLTDGSHTSSKEFSIENGLQQGTVNSPVLSGIYNSDLLNLFNLNTSTHKRSIAFADDLIIYVTGRRTKTIRTELQELFNKISDYYYTWKLKINASKCETILFRSKTSKIGPIERERCKKFQLKEKANEGELIPHKNCIKYHKYGWKTKLQATHRNPTLQSQQSILEYKKIVLFQTSQ